MKRVFITTTDSIEGAKIVSYKGLVSSNIVAGTDIISDFVAGLSDIFGGRSGTYRRHMEAIYSEALDEISEKAIQNNANAVVGFKIDFDNISAKGMSMFMVSITGTAVLVDFSEEDKEPSSNIAITSNTLEAELRKRTIVSFLTTEEPYMSESMWKLVLSDSQGDYAKELSNVLIRYAKSTQLDPSRLDLHKSYFSKYISNIEKNDSIPIVYSLVPTIPDFAHELIINNHLFDAKCVLELLDQGLISDVCKILQVKKETYVQEELVEMKEISDRLHHLPRLGKTVIAKVGIFSKEAECYICPEGHINSLETEFCNECGKNMFGLTKKEVNSIEQFDKIIEALEYLFSQQQ